VSGDPFPHLEANFGQRAGILEQHARPQFAALLVHQVERAALGVDGRHQLVEDQVEQVVELDIRGHHLADRAHGVQFLHGTHRRSAGSGPLDQLDQLERVGLAQFGAGGALYGVHQRVDEVQAHTPLDARLYWRVDVERLDFGGVQRDAPIGQRDLDKIARFAGRDQQMPFALAWIGVADDVGRGLFNGQLQIKKCPVGQREALPDALHEVRDEAQVLLPGLDAKLTEEGHGVAPRIIWWGLLAGALRCCALIYLTPARR